MTRSPARRLGTLALAALALGAGAASASAATVTSGKLDWSTTKIYDTGAPAGTDRTWLGYVTSASPLAAGTASASDGASGDEITTATASGTVATWSYPATTGDYEPATGTGTVSFDGTVSFVSPAPPAGHGFTITLTDPRVVLAGDDGQLFASGVSSTGPYADALPVFDLDLSAATVTLHADGSRTIAGIVPSLATASLVFPANYRAGAGPDRTPNTFGAFSIRVKTAPVAGPKGEKGDKGDAGAAGKVVYVQSGLLRKAPFRDGGRKHAISLLTAKGKRVVASGSVRARTIKVRLAEGRTKRLHGVFLLKAGTRDPIRVRVL